MGASVYRAYRDRSPVLYRVYRGYTGSTRSKRRSLPLKRELGKLGVVNHCRWSLASTPQASMVPSKFRNIGANASKIELIARVTTRPCQACGARCQYNKFSHVK